MTPERLQSIVNYNSWGNEHADLGLAGLRSEPLGKSSIGLWGEYAMINHSCAPNTVNFVVGESMLVRYIVANSRFISLKMSIVS